MHDNRKGFEELKRHPWFANINWNTLDTKEQIAPFIPDVSIVLFWLADPHLLTFGLQNKKANFDASHELEELLLEDNPLRAKQRKERDLSSLSAEMRQMEEQYVTRLLFFGPTQSRDQPPTDTMRSL